MWAYCNGLQDQPGVDCGPGTGLAFIRLAGRPPGSPGQAKMELEIYTASCLAANFICFLALAAFAVVVEIRTLYL
jgi:hypothetical protein